MVLCDTNIISELARSRPNTGILEWAKEHSTIHLSVITIEELRFGLAWKPNPRIGYWLDDFVLTYCTLLPVSEKIAALAGELRGNFQAKGETRTQADMLIAATACVHELTLVTRNIRDLSACGINLINPFS